MRPARHYPSKQSLCQSECLSKDGELRTNSGSACHYPSSTVIKRQRLFRRAVFRLFRIRYTLASCPAADGGGWHLSTTPPPDPGAFCRILTTGGSDRANLNSPAVRATSPVGAAAPAVTCPAWWRPAGFPRWPRAKHRGSSDTPVLRSPEDCAPVVRVPRR